MLKYKAIKNNKNNFYEATSYQHTTNDINSLIKAIYNPPIFNVLSDLNDNKSLHKSMPFVSVTACSDSSQIKSTEYILNLDSEISSPPIFLNKHHKLTNEVPFTYQNLDKPDRSLAEFTKTIKLSPGDVNAYFDRALVYCALGEYRQALDDIAAVMRLSPHFLAVHFNRVRRKITTSEYKAHKKEAPLMEHYVDNNMAPFYKLGLELSQIFVKSKDNIFFHHEDAISCDQLISNPLPDFVKQSVLALALNKAGQNKLFPMYLYTGLYFDNEEILTTLEKSLRALTGDVMLTRQEIEKCVLEAVSSRRDILLRPLQATNLAFYHTHRHEKNFLQYKLFMMGNDIPFVLCCQKKLREMEETIISRTSFAVIAQDIKTALYSGKDHSAVIKEFDLFVQLYRLEEGLRPAGVGSVLLEEFLSSRGMQERIPFVHKKVSQGKTAWRREDFEDIFEFNPSQGYSFAGGSVKPSEEFILPKVIFPEEEMGLVYQAQREHQPPGPYPSIRTLIDPKKFKLFVQKLFERDEKAYQTFIDKIDRTDKWREAKKLIDRELKKRNLDLNSREAVELGDIIFARYFKNSTD